MDSKDLGVLSEFLLREHRKLPRELIEDGTRRRELRRDVSEPAPLLRVQTGKSPLSSEIQDFTSNHHPKSGFFENTPLSLHSSTSCF